MMKRLFLCKYHLSGRLRNLVFPLVVCFTMCQGLSTLAASTEVSVTDCRSVSLPDVVITDSQCQALNFFFTTFLNLPIKQIRNAVYRPEDTPWQFGRFMVDGNEVAVSTAGVCWFARGDTYHEAGSETKRVDQAISKEEAFENALPLIRYCNAPVDPGEYEFWFDDEQKKPEDSLEHCYWRLRHHYKHEGLAYIGPVLSIRVSAYSGRVNIFNYHAPTRPEPEPATPITKAEAVQATRTWVVKRDNRTTRGRGTVPNDAIEKTAKVVCFPNKRSWYSMERLRPNQSRYCWAVPFSWSEDTYDGSMVGHSYAAVEMATGQVIAAFGDLR